MQTRPQATLENLIDKCSKNNYVSNVKKEIEYFHLNVFTM